MTSSVINTQSPVSAARRSFVLFLAFIYFFTTSADLLHIKASLFHFKVNHILAFLLILIFSLEQKKWILPDKKFVLAFFATLLAMGISGIFGAYPYRSLMYVFVYFFTFIAYFLLPFNLLMAYGKETIFKLYFAAFVATGISGALQFFLSVFGIVAPFVTQSVADRFSRAQAMTHEPSYFALFMVPYVMYYNARFLYDSKKILDFSKLRSLFWKNLLLLVSTSTGAFFAYFVFVVVISFTTVFAWVKDRRKKLINKLLKLGVLFAFFFAGIAAMLPQLFLESFWKFFDMGFMKHWSFYERWNGIITAWEIFLDHPIFGAGVGGIGPLVYQQAVADGYKIAIHEPYMKMFEPYDPTNAVSELFASMGCVGVITFSWMFFIYFRYLLQTAKIPQLSQEEKSTIYGLLVSIGVMLIVLQFNQNLFRSYIWVHLALSLGYMFSIRGKYEQRG